VPNLFFGDFSHWVGLNHIHSTCELLA